MFGLYSERQVKELCAIKDEHIGFLRQELNKAYESLENQRRRADLAVDRLLEAKKVNTIMPERSGLLSAEERERVSKQIKEAEIFKAALESVGDCGGDPDEFLGPTHKEVIAGA